MKRQFDDAIRKTGSSAALLDNKNRRFAVSIQPDGVYGDGHTETGRGHFSRFKLYAVYNEITMDLSEESIIECDGHLYVVSHIEAVRLGGEPMYLRGTIVRAKEAEAHGKSNGA